MKKSFLLFFFFLTAGCSNLLFHPEKEFVLEPSRLELPYDNLSLQTADGIKLHAWFIPAYCSGRTPCPAKANILFLHGNAENISSHTFSVLWLILYGAGLPRFRQVRRICQPVGIRNGHSNGNQLSAGKISRPAFVCFRAEHRRFFGRFRRRPV